MPALPEGFTALAPVPGPKTYDLYAIGTGRPVILVHEMTGVTPETLRLARDLANEGFRVYLPVLFGDFPQPDGLAPKLRAIAHVCLSREFHLLSTGQTSPVTHWLKNVTQWVAAQHPERKVGLIGMCLTGGFVLVMMLALQAGAVVVCQPTIPLALTGRARRSYGLSVRDVAAAQAHRPALPILGLRYARDIICPRERLEQVRTDFPQAQVIYLPGGSGPVSHATLTEQRSAQAVQLVFSFLNQHL